MLKKYNDFIFESLLNESVLVYSDKFKSLIKKIDSPISTALIDTESKDINKLSNNYIDIADDKEKISFIADRKAQEILNPENAQKVAIYNGSSGFLKHSDANKEIFSLLEYEPVGDACYHPSNGERGDVITKAVSPSSGNTYLKISFPAGISIINQNAIRYEDVSKIPFSKNRQSIRVGRGVKGILTSAGLKFPDAEIEIFVNKYNRMHNV